jgi:predicted transcriptional regulator
MEKLQRIERNKLIFNLHDQGFSCREISKKVGLSKTGVHKIVSSKKPKSKPKIKMSLAIRNRIKQRNHMKNLVEELKKDVLEANRIIDRYEKTIKILDFELNDYDEQIKKETK